MNSNENSELGRESMVDCSSGNLESRPDTSNSKKTESPALSLLCGDALSDSVPSSWSLADILHRAAYQGGNKGVRILDDDEGDCFLSYEHLYKSAQEVAGGLGFEYGDLCSHAMIVIKNRKEFLLAFWGCVLAGVVPVPCAFPTDTYSRDWLNFNSVRHSLNEPLIITSHADRPFLSSLAENMVDSGQLVDVETLAASEMPARHIARIADDIVFLLMTSGSSGTPKLVIHTHRTVKAYCAGSSKLNDFGSEDITLNWIPLDHVGALVMMHIQSTWLVCQQIQASITAFLYRPFRWLDWIDRYRVSVTWAPNFAFSLVNQYEDNIKERCWDLSCLRMILNGGEPIIRAQASRFLSLLQKAKIPATAMRPVWGMSETCSGVIFSESFHVEQGLYESRYVEVGRPIPGFSLKVVGPDGQILPEGEIGELEVRGESVTPGYYLNEAANAESFLADGWFRTGDTATVENGQLAIVGRSKQIIIINGCNYSVSEVEAIVASIPGVDATCIVAVSMRKISASTEQIGVALALKPAYRLQHEHILREIRRTLMRTFRCASPVLMVVSNDAISRTSSGKVLRDEVKKILEGDSDNILNRNITEDKALE
jgi:acyl-CoA synthetase (AMP-forming)/AMP-acid ligase II